MVAMTHALAVWCQVAAGLGHCLGVTQKGDVVAWGWAAAGQLGLGHSHKGSHAVVHPTQVGSMVRHVLVICAIQPGVSYNSGNMLWSTL